MKKRFFPGLALLVLCSALSFAQDIPTALAVSRTTRAEQPWWFTLEQGKRLFRSGVYGDALMAFEDARRARLDQFTRMRENFIFLLSTPDVRLMGDSLEAVEKHIASRRDVSSQSILAELYHRVPRESLNGSVQRALDELDRLKSYPEAEFWLGESYRLEGELGLALRQYERAWHGRALLESPGFDAEILYRMTEIHRLRREFQEMESRAKEIIEGPDHSGVPRDLLWAGNSANPAASSNLVRAAMTRILENEGVNRFISLYRHENTGVEKAHRLLGFFYYSSGRYIPAAEHLMFAFLIQNTVLINEIIRGDFDFIFTSLENLEFLVNRRPALSAFCEDNEYYRTAYYLSSALYAAGKSRPAMQIWTFLSRSNSAGEWGSRARRYASPFVERAAQ
jgi:tetratricopeptide (TPR) repeat protein